VDDVMLQTVSLKLDCLKLGRASAIELQHMANSTDNVAFIDICCHQGFELHQVKSSVLCELEEQYCVGYLR
jgi:hypothetical protein